ncbi:hypothetical protein SAMN05877838_2589 [Hoeflea halophila]|uniref:Uncharacterized protein n=1 Tax=Hoeflea halophila TaxID=714899 RepID=A0A286IDG2_9HYPH|nr:hypothetical protein SAMN05877838_2589 [Hoeflea halophila]
MSTAVRPVKPVLLRNRLAPAFVSSGVKPLMRRSNK